MGAPRFVALAAILLLCACGESGSTRDAAVRLPPGFRLDVYAADVPGARSLALGPSGTVFVGTRKPGKVYALIDADKDGRAERVLTVAKGLDEPNGIDVLGDDLYVAEVGRILRYPGYAKDPESAAPPVVVFDGLPKARHHGWRYLRVGPDRKLYVAVGAPCNVCDELGEIRRMEADGSGAEVYARGVRNSVGFDWHPRNGALWFTDNGRDWLSDDMPPDELNRAPVPGLHFGFPYCHGGDLPDPEFGEGKHCRDYVAPVRRLGAHVAALGMRFYTGTRFPVPYRRQIFIAEHGSWNRSTKTGYRISLVRLDGARAVAYETFAEGWLDAGGEVRGRPVDLLVSRDGALLVSDDHAGAVYRISYQE